MVPDESLHDAIRAQIARDIAAERNACATLADEMADRYDKNAANPNERGAEMRHTALALRALASAIRARHRMTP